MMILTNSQTEEVAQRMFNAYNEYGPHPWRTFDGRPVPKWNELSGAVRAKWRAAACEAAAAVDALT